MTDRLTLITKTFEGASVRAVNHPEHGELLHALDVLKVCGYATGSGSSTTLKYAGVTAEHRIVLAGDTLIVPRGIGRSIPGSATFVTRTGINLLLLTSTKPKAQAFREWLAGDVVNAIVDTGGYLLNEAARDTARADTRTSVPLPEEIGGTYAALIAEKKGRVGAP